MIAELLEKFEDIFQPLPPEEVEKRGHKFRVSFYDIVDNKIKEVKEVDVSVSEFDDISIYRKALRKLGIEDAKHRIHRTPSIGVRLGRGGFHNNWFVNIKLSDNIVDNDGNTMDGDYRLGMRFKEERGM